MIRDTFLCTRNRAIISKYYHTWYVRMYAILYDVGVCTGSMNNVFIVLVDVGYGVVCVLLLLCVVYRDKPVELSDFGLQKKKTKVFVLPRKVLRSNFWTNKLISLVVQEK